MKKCNDDDDATSLDETLANLTLVLKKKQQVLEEREEAVAKATAALNRDRSEVFGDKSDSDVLHLNVGGDTTMAVLRRTLTSVEGSMLASRFSGRWDESLEKDRNGNFFIDQPMELFKPMINYLRAKACEMPLGPPVKSPHPKDYEMRQDFYRLVEYFGMTAGIYPTIIELHRGEPGSADIGCYQDRSVKSSEWSTFTVQTQGHAREITSFEVVLGNVERMQIGWINESMYVENLSNDHRNGVGEEENSLALDCCRGGLLNQGEFTKFEGLSIGAGSVIRCEQKGHRWLVDGELVASSIASDDNTRHFENDFLPPAGHVNNSNDKIIPCFSGKGHWTLSQIVLSCP
mmetsp:Transcript_18233/g.32929  ORF Transcript_18233/g.32929 Transcript_18233/m.32929 type:complete len:346 (+) Transcript_18233:63-1100(+)